MWSICISGSVFVNLYREQCSPVTCRVLFLPASCDTVHEANSEKGMKSHYCSEDKPWRSLGCFSSVTLSRCCVTAPVVQQFVFSNCLLFLFSLRPRESAAHLQTFEWKAVCAGRKSKCVTGSGGGDPDKNVHYKSLSLVKLLFPYKDTLSFYWLKCDTETPLPLLTLASLSFDLTQKRSVCRWGGSVWHSALPPPGRPRWSSARLFTSNPPQFTTCPSSCPLHNQLFTRSIVQ